MNGAEMFTPSQNLIEAGTTSMAGQTGAHFGRNGHQLQRRTCQRHGPLYERVASVIPSVEWPFFAPYIKAINDLKREKMRGIGA